MENAVSEIRQTKENETLILDGRINLQDYRDYWFEEFKGSLSNTLAFWGTAIAISLWLVFLSRDSTNLFVFFLFVSSILFFIPILLTLFSYQNFVKTARRYVQSLTDEEKNFTYTFSLDSDGFECLHGRSYSFIAWSSIESVTEKLNYFVLVRQIQPFLISKTDFRNAVQIESFRLILAAKLGDKTKLLNQM